MNHVSNGQCLKCLTIMNLYDGIHEDLKSWFVMMQARHPEIHVSEAGRGEERQRVLYLEGKSRARWSESAHNYNCAIDVFCLFDDGRDIYNKVWFHEVLAPEIPNFLTWYGAPGAKFPELPHIEVKDWKKLVEKKKVSLVKKMRGLS